MFQQLPILDFDEIEHIDDRLVMDAIAKSSNLNITLALIDASTAIKTKLFKNMPRSRASIIREEMISNLRTYTPRGGELAQRYILELINKRIIEDL
jgi:flagellar motor switch protein FliG